MSPAAVPARDRAERFGLRSPAIGAGIFEARALLEFSSLLPALPSLLELPRGDGRPVMTLPGFGADDASTWPLRQFLSSLGYRPLPWALGVNDDPEVAAERLLERLQTTRVADEPITFIGWSLGGIVARLVALHSPSSVREVITMGTPVEGGPKYTSIGGLYARGRGLNLDEFEARVHSVNSQGIDAPLTVIFSRTDGVVGWRAAIDRYNPQARHVEVRSSHLGLGANPSVYRIIARTLAGKSVKLASPDLTV
ncbi:MAG: alpha/beta fold hydrolase [Pseudomonadota bacterium]